MERQLQEWSHLLRIGKKLKVGASFKFAESGKAARTAGRGATATQLAESDVRIDAEQASLGDTSPSRHVYQVFRCPGPPRGRGPYSWLDPNGHKQARYRPAGPDAVFAFPRAFQRCCYGSGSLNSRRIARLNLLWSPSPFSTGRTGLRKSKRLRITLSWRSSRPSNHSTTPQSNSRLNLHSFAAQWPPASWTSGASLFRYFRS